MVLGFGRYFSMLIPEDAASLSLFSFAIGVELAQIFIVLGVLFINVLVLQIFKMQPSKMGIFDWCNGPFSSFSNDI